MVLKNIGTLREVHTMYADMAQQKVSMSSRLKAEEDKVRQDISRAAADRLSAAVIQAELVEQDLAAKLASLESKAEWFAARFAP